MKQSGQRKGPPEYWVYVSLETRNLTIKVHRIRSGEIAFDGEPLFFFNEKVELTKAWQIVDTYFETYLALADVYMGTALDTYAAFDLNMTILNFYVRNKPTNLWFEFSPFKYWYSSPSSMEHLMSFINTSIFWDWWGQLKFSTAVSDSIRVWGPYISLNYLIVENFEQVITDTIIFGAGVKLSYYQGLMGHDAHHFKAYQDYYTSSLALDIGYRNKLGVHQCYIGIQLFNLDLFIRQVR